MNILALDPSTTAIGWAVVDDSGDPNRCRAFGVIHRPGDWPWSIRLRAMTQELTPILPERIDAAVIEVPGPRQAKHGAKNKQGLTASTSGRYALAPGAVLGLCWARYPGVPIISVESDTWTALGGTWGVRKDRRVGQLTAVCPAYARASDPGGDIADAIMLGCWWAARYARRAAETWPLQVPEAHMGKGPTRRTLTHGSVEYAPAVRPGRVGRASKRSSD